MIISPSPLTDDLSSLAPDQILKLAKRFAANPGFKSAGRQLKVALLAGFLTDFLAQALCLMLARRGFAVELWRGDYGVMAQTVLEPSSDLHAFGPDLVILLPTHRDLRCVPGFGADGGAAARDEASFWIALWEKLACPVVQLSFDPPPARPLGELDGIIVGGLLDHVRSANRALAQAASGRVALVDADYLVARLGFDRWHDARLFALCKQPFSMEAIPALADALSAAAAGLMGRGRKCLVLDLDNTLWGGEIGDLENEGITLGSETPEGEAFVTFQTYCKRLAERGVVLAVCSKNHDEIARQPFRSHGAMVLKDADIACFVANFEDKATNIRRIAETLNLGLDALVFCDDNPVERAWVREQLPQVLTIEMPDEPTLYVRALDDSAAFPIATLTNEDRARAGSYRARAATQEAMAQAADMDRFLASLEPVAVIEPVAPDTLDRIVQIIAKTNQFKLNSTVFDAAAITAKGANVLAIRLKDRVQDYGIVAVAVTEPQGECLRILNWVMSCRVFSRRLEHFTRLELARMAGEQGLSGLILAYEPSSKNGLLDTILPMLGFAGGEGNDWTASLSAPVGLPPHRMKIERVSR